MNVIHPDQTIGILGFGKEGQSTYAYLQKKGFCNLRVLDKNRNEAFVDQVEYFSGQDYLEGLRGCNVVFRSAGVYPKTRELQAFIQEGGVLTSQVEYFLEIVSNPIVGVTGSFGKGTCVSLLEAMFQEANKPCRVGGNIGTPVLDLLECLLPEDTVLLELSSFQLMNLKKSPAHAIWLNTTEEHLDWHQDLDEYHAAKANLVTTQDRSDVCVYFAQSEAVQKHIQKNIGVKLSYAYEDSEASSSAVIAKDAVHFEGGAIRLDETNFVGAFNLENIAAASLMALEFEIPFSIIQKACERFEPLQFRLQYINEGNGLKFYNDSYATRPDATMAAIDAFHNEDVGLILGGSDKGVDLSELCETISQSSNIKTIALIGETSGKLYDLLSKYNVLRKVKVEKKSSLDDAFSYIVKELEKGIVLLSPACASFGLFKSYVHRGQEFNKIVSRYMGNIHVAE